MPDKPKTQVTGADPLAFIAASARPTDGAELCAMMQRASGEPPRMWGPSIVGFGRRAYALAGGRTGETLAIGFSPRKPALVLYLPHAPGWDERLARLGKHGTGKGCLYIARLAEVDAAVLEELVGAAWTQAAQSSI